MAGRLIAVDDPGKPDVRALLEQHRTFALGQTPPEHSFALDADALRDPAITFFSFRLCGSLLAIGAIKRLGPEHAEIKSMHTAEAARGRGIGRAMLAHLLGGSARVRRPASQPGDRDHGGIRPGPGAVPQRGLRLVRSVRAATSRAKTTCS